MTEPRKYACPYCNYPFETFPPDDIYIVLLPTACEVGDNRILPHDCENCQKRIELYWHPDRKHTIWEFENAKRRRGKPSIFDRL